jgi:hypothetical protein
MSRTRPRWLAVGLVVALSTGGVSAYGAVHTAATNKSAAEADAASLLASLNLPASAVRQAAEPTGDDGTLAQAASYPGTPNLVDDHAWWVVPETTQQVVAYIAEHPPAGGKPSLSGQSSGPDQPTVTDTGFGWPSVPGALDMRSLVVSVVALNDGSTGVRADGEAVWITPRPRSERIPATARRVVVTNSRGRTLVQGPITVTSRATVRRVVSVLNRLPAWQPGVYSCPADFGWHIRAAFYATRAPGSRPIAVATITTTGCSVVRLTLAGKAQPALADGYAATKQIGALLHVRFDTSPTPFHPIIDTGATPFRPIK